MTNRATSTGSFRALTGRIWAFFHKRPLDAELEAEFSSHIEFAIDENTRAGMNPEEARRQALIRFGGISQARELHRQTRGLPFFDVLGQDLRFTLRTLRREPGFTIVAVLILALAIGANIAVFSVVNTLLLRPLPFPNAGQLVWIAPPPTKCGLSCATYSTDAYDQFRTTTHSFQAVTGYFAFSGADNLSLSLHGGAPIPATSIEVIANFFQVMGVQPAMGRTFTLDDGRDGAPPVVILTNAWWRRQFAADPHIVGKAFDISGRQTTVIGVLPASFDFGAVFSPGVKIDAIAPLDLYGPPRDWGNIITFIGRMKPGVSLAQARADSKAASQVMCWNFRYPNTCGDYKDQVVPVPLKDYISGRLRRSLVVLWSAVGAILLIACVNLSNLMLARAAARSKEFAMRGALGASRGRIVRQLLTESLMLSGMGALLGLGLAALMIAWLSHQGSIALPLLGTLHIDAAALGWTVLIAILAATLFGLLPGLRMAGGNLYESLKDSGTGASQGRKHERTRAILVVTEFALACTLLVGAGLLLRSFLKVLDVDLGFQPERSAAVRVDYDDAVPNDKTGALRAEKRRVIFQQVLSQVGAIPGVEAAGIVDYLPLGQNRAWGLPVPHGWNRNQFKDVDGPLVYVVSPGYFRSMGARLRGRDFSWDDGPTNEPVAVISRSMAHYFWPNEDAVGKTMDGGGPSDHERIVGVVDDFREETVEGAGGWQIYYPMTQASPSYAELVVRTRLEPALVAGSVVSALRQLNPKQTVAEFRPIETLVSHAVSPRRFFMLLVAAFALLGLLLAALGIYGVISYSVTRQTQEIGIRMALGATREKVQLGVLRRTLRLAVIGISIGAAASLGVTALVASLLFETHPADPITFSAVVFLLASVAGLAGYLPARRAAHVNPMVALRNN